MPLCQVGRPEKLTPGGTRVLAIGGLSELARSLSSLPAALWPSALYRGCELCLGARYLSKFFFREQKIFFESRMIWVFLLHVLYHLSHASARSATVQYDLSC